MSLTRKLPLVMVGLALAASLVTGFLALTNFERELKRSEQSQLVALLEARSAELDRFFARMRAGLHLYVRNPAVQESVAEFSSAYATLALVTDASAYLSQAFRAGGSWDTGDAEGDHYADYYRQVHDEFHPWLQETRINWDLNDLLLIDPQGNLVYTTSKHADFTGNVAEGPLAETVLGTLYRHIKPNPAGVTTTYSDLVRFNAAGGAPVMFLAAPVFSRTGTWTGIVVLEIPVTPINAILAVKKGMGQTGETYVVGADGLMRSQSRFTSDSSVLKTKVDGGTFHLALTGDAGVDVTDDYRGRRVYSAYGPLAVDGLRWVILSEIDEDEILARVRSARSDILWILLSITALLLLIGTFMARRIARPIRRVTKAMTGLAEGDLGVGLSERPRRDEIGLLVGSFETLRENEVERRRLGAEVRKQNRIAQAALENMGQALVMVDGEGRIVARNARFAEQFDLTEDQVADGRPFADLAGDLAACAGGGGGEGGDGGTADPAACQWIRQSADRAKTESIELALTDGRTYEVRHMPLPQGGFVQTYTNITERKAAEAEIAAKERLLRIALDNMSDGIFMVDEDLRFQMFNQRYVDLAELPEGVVQVGGSIRDVLQYNAERGFYGDGDVPALVRARLETYTDETFAEFELDTPGGRTNAFRKASLPDGGAVVVISDITERKENERRMRENERQLAGILDSSPVGAGISRLSDGKILFVNQRQCELLGVTIDEMMRRSRADFYPDLARADEMARRFTEDGAVHGFEIDIRRGDGSTFPALVSLLPLEYGGEACRLVWIFDLSDIKAAQEVVARSHRQLTAMLETSPIGVVITHRDSERMVYCNSRQAQMLGVDRDAYLTGPSGGHWADPDALRRAKESLDRGDAIRDMEVRMRRADGGEFWALVNIFAFDYAGEPARVSWFYDISARKEAEAELARTLDGLNAIMEAIDYGVLFMDGDLRYRYCNKAYRDLWRIPEEVLADRPSMEDFIRMNRHTGVYAVDDADFDAFVADRVAAVRAGPVPPTEMTRADGRTLIYQKVALRDGGAMLTYFDITERKDDERRLNEAYEVISSSIQYASRIQRSILPDPGVFDALFADHFVHWEPRDVVGGDIYWCAEWGAGALVVLGDCTGHGVPGAFMTLIAIGALDRALAEVPEGQVARLMQRMHQLVQVTLNQHGSGGVSDDGMELGICYMPADAAAMTYVGARFSLFAVEDGQVKEIKGDRTGIGYRHVPHDATFTEVPVALGPGRSFYMTSDGLVDQLGGAKCRSFGKRRFKDLIAAFHGEAFAARRERILGAFNAYQGDEMRRDDVALLGFTLDKSPSPA